MRRLLALVLLPSIVLGSCGMFGKKMKGSGNTGSESRAITGYTSIDVSGSIDVYVRQDSNTSVRIETDDNLLGLVDVYEEGGVLRIKTKRGYNLRPTRGINVYVSGPEFRRFEASGACDFFSENMISSTGSIDIDLSGSCDAKMQLRAPRITADIAGSGSVTLSGETRELSVDGSGSSKFRCIDLLAENVEVDITGSGSAEVFASVKLDVDVAGSGNVKYRGQAAVSQSVSGSGSVTKIP